MKVVGVREAKANLSRMIDAAAKGEPFVIARAGRPLVRVTAVDASPTTRRRLGFMAGALAVLGDFDALGRDEIARLFGSAGSLGG